MPIDYSLAESVHQPLYQTITFARYRRVTLLFTYLEWSVGGHYQAQA